MFIFLYIYVFFGSDFSLICVFTPFYALFGTVSRLHAKSASLKWSICRSVLFKLIVTLICCFWSSAIGDCASMFLKVYVSVFHYSLVRKSLVNMCLYMYFQDNLIFEDRILWGCLWRCCFAYIVFTLFLLTLLYLPHVLSFFLRFWFIHASVFCAFANRIPASCPSIYCISTATRAKADLYCAWLCQNILLANMEVHESWWLTKYSNFFNSVSGLAIELCRALHSPGTDTQIQCQQHSGSLHMFGPSDAQNIPHSGSNSLITFLQSNPPKSPKKVHGNDLQWIFFVPESCNQLFQG